MEIETVYTAVERVKYKFSEAEVNDALIEYVMRHRAVPKGGGWSSEWWDDDNGRLVVELTHMLTKKVDKADDGVREAVELKERGIGEKGE